MKLKLTTEDRKAIDLLLGETAAASQVPTRSYVVAAGTKQVEAVRRVLQLLQVLPLTEPAADLAARTLSRISQSTGQIIETPATRAV